MSFTADQVIAELGLIPHPEGGAFRETYRAPESVAGREDHCAATLIYFLLRVGQVSSWHRVLGADEHFLFHGGDPYRLIWIGGDGGLHDQPVGMAIDAGERPQRTVSAGCWQAAYVDAGGAHGWSLVACVVSPGFEFADFEMATDDEILALYPDLDGPVRLPRL
ncbi:MAG: cupin domain-containing protein [Capsulimonadaceae bacterium]|nr:cupin domain-containing protein [Capsulimonadaceae bacterium]